MVTSGGSWLVEAVTILDRGNRLPPCVSHNVDDIYGGVCHSLDDEDARVATLRGSSRSVATQCAG